MIAFTFWAGPQFSLLNLISLLSYARLNPSHELIIYSVREATDINPNWSTGEHSGSINKVYPLSALAEEPNIRIVYLDEDASIPRFNSVVHLADYVRIRKMFDHGGVWIDADILFIQPIHEQHKINSAPLGVISYFNTIATGFLYGQKGAPIIGLLHDRAKAMIESGSFLGRYESLGPDLWEAVLLTHRGQAYDCHFMPVDLIYPYKAPQLDRFYHSPNCDLIDQNVMGIHWYNGDKRTKAFINFHLDAVLRHQYCATPFHLVIDRLRHQINLDSFLQSHC